MDYMVYFVRLFLTSALPVVGPLMNISITNLKKEKTRPQLTLTCLLITLHSMNCQVKFKINMHSLPLISSSVVFTPAHKHTGRRKQRCSSPQHHVLLQWRMWPFSFRKEHLCAMRDTLWQSQLKELCPYSEKQLRRYRIMNLWQVVHCIDRCNRSSIEYRLCVKGEAIQLSNKKYWHSSGLMSSFCKIPPHTQLTRPTSLHRMVWGGDIKLELLGLSFWQQHLSSAFYLCSVTFSFCIFHSSYATPIALPPAVHGEGFSSLLFLWRFFCVYYHWTSVDLTEWMTILKIWWEIPAWTKTVQFYEHLLESESPVGTFLEAQTSW